MKVIKPTAVTPFDIISSSLSETEAAWVSNTNYAQGDIVYDNYDGIYQALVANINKQPKNNPLEWAYIRPSNRWAAFDTEISTSSVYSATPASTPISINYRLKTGDMQGIALLNLVGNTVTITMYDKNPGIIGAATIYSKTQSLIGEVGDWYQYFFYDLETQRNQAVFVDLPLNYTNSYVDISIEGLGTVSVGKIIFGRLASIGKSQYGATSGITDYSIKDTDEFGTTTFVRRAFSKRMSANVLVPNSELNRVQRLLYDLRAKPSIWFASENPQLEEALVVYGYYKDFSTDISYPNYSYCSLEIEGLI
jgi:hypothetical protein